MVVLASAARTTSGQSDAELNNRFRGVLLFLDITAVSGTSPSLDVKVQVQDPASENWIDLDIAEFSNKTAVGSDTLTIYPGVAEKPNRGVSDVLPEYWRVAYTIGGTTPSFTFSVGAVYLP